MPDSKNRPPPKIDLLNYHRPRLPRRRDTHPIPPLSIESKSLVNYRAPRAKFQVPRSRRAAVLVALFVGRMGDLYVLLSRRSSTLRTYSGDTALPGGKVDDVDKTIEDTARREAFEEIGLPIDRNKVPLLCILEPFLAGNQLVVTPVVVLILDNTLKPILNAAEVASLFSHPLSSFLTSIPPFPSEPEMVEVDYHTFQDIDWANHVVRFHRFLTGREAGGIKPVFGLTAAILIKAATVGYGHAPDFDVNAAGQPAMEQRIAYSLLTHPVFQKAFETEHIKPDYKLLKSIAKPLLEEKEPKRKRRVRSKL